MHTLAGRQRYLAILTVLGVLAAAMVLIEPARAARRGVELSGAVSRTISPVSQNDLTFRTVRMEIDYRGGPVRLSSTADGSGSIATDDAMTFLVRKGKKAQPPLAIDFSRSCIGLEPRPAQDVTGLFRPGVNHVTLMLHDRCGVAYSSDPYFLVGDLSPRNPPVENQLGDGVNPGVFGDPVNTAIGNFHHQTTDLVFPGHVYGMDLTRSYNARDNEVGALGQGWLLGFEARIVEEEGGAVSLRQGDGRVVRFEPGAGGFLPAPQFFGTLARDADGTATIDWPGQETWTFAEGRLVEKRNWDTQTVTITYAAEGVTQVAGAYGCALVFAYDPGGRLESVTTADGRRVSYRYDTQGHLEPVTDPAGATTSHAYDESGRLRGITDAEGRTVVRLTYDEDGRVVKQVNRHGGTATFAYDADGNSTAVRDESTGAELRFDHDPAGQLQQVTDPFGLASGRSYDTAGNLVGATRRSGAEIQQTFDGRGNVTSRTVGGATVRFAYDDLDRLVSTIDPTGGVTTYSYAGASRLLNSRTDPCGGVTRFESAGGRITSVNDPDGVTTRFGYDAAGNLQSVADGVGAETTFTYDAAGRQVGTRSPLGSMEHSEYDGAGRRLVLTDRTGNTSRFRYSPGGLLLETTDPTGARTSFTYDAAGRLASEIGASGAEVVYEYDDAGNVSSRRDPDGTVTRFEYDALSRVVKETDPQGVVVRHTYGPDGEELATIEAESGRTATELDERGNTVGSTDPLGAVTRFRYDLADRLVAEVDATGSERQVRYDPCGRVIGEVNPLGATTLRRWTPGGRLSQVEDPLGGVTRYAYDAAGRLESVTDPAGGTTRYAYDLDGGRISTTSPTGLVTGAEFDAAGRQVRAVSPDGATTTTVYSPRGEPISETDAMGATRRFEYDALGELVAASDANGAVTRYTYDPAGRRTSMSDAKGGLTRWVYDSAGRETERIDPLGRISRKSYDETGRLRAETLPTGEAVEWGYDAANRVTSKKAGGATIRFTYDAAGRRVGMEDGTGNTRYRYDPAGQLVEVTLPDGSTLATTYDAAGQVTGMRYPSGGQLAYAYDPAGRLVRLEHTGVRRAFGAEAAPRPRAMLPKTIGLYIEPPRPGAMLLEGESGEVMRLVQFAEPASVVASFEVDADGRLIGESLPGGAARRYGYRSGLLETFSHTTEKADGGKTSTARIERDGVGRVVALATAAGTKRFAYDAAGQLTAEDGPGDGARYEYDVTGNRIAGRGDSGDTLYRYDAAHQLVESETDGKVTSYRYDEAGRLVGTSGPKGNRTLEYDAFGRLATETSSAKAGTTRRMMDYDGDNLLRSVTVRSQGSKSEPAEVRQQYTWSVVGEVPQILAVTGQAAADLVYGYGRTLLASDTGTTTFSADVFGSTLVTDSTRDLARSEVYDAFGVPRPAPSSSYLSPTFGYRGELTVGEDVYLRSRRYEPALGRFLTTDPLDGMPGTTTAANPYQYADNDPLNQIDPLGERATDDDIRTPVDYGRARHRTVDFRFAPQPGRGTVRVGLYIPTESAGLPGVNALRSHGDNRGPSPDANLSRHRAVATVTYETGRAQFRINPSCGLGGPPGDCHDPLPIIDDFGTGARLWQKIPIFVGDSNRVKLSTKSRNAIHIRWAILNSDKRTFAPSIDGSVTVKPLGPRSVCIEYHRDAYPALEAYQYLPGASPADLLHQNAAWNADRGLLPLPFTDKDGTTCPKGTAPGRGGRPDGRVA